MPTKQMVRAEAVFHEAVAAVRVVAQQIRRGSERVDFARAEAALEALPLASDDFSVISNHLVNADCYATRREQGAACFELRLLLARLGRQYASFGQGVSRYQRCSG